MHESPAQYTMLDKSVWHQDGSDSAVLNIRFLTMASLLQILEDTTHLCQHSNIVFNELHRVICWATIQIIAVPRVLGTLVNRCSWSFSASNTTLPVRLKLYCGTHEPVETCTIKVISV